MEKPSQFGEYVLLNKVAAGGMAEIYRGQLRGLGGFRRDVAIKRILPQLDEPDLVPMLLDEARLSARLIHPNIAQVLNCGCIEGVHYIAMEFVDGQSVSRMQKVLSNQGRRLPVAACLHIGIMLARGLDYAHKYTNEKNEHVGIIHRDVSPQNIIVSYDGAVKLIDFGVAWSANRLVKTETGLIKGKLAYMAPEQLSDQMIDHRSDQYAAAIVLAELASGVRAYSANTYSELLRAAMAAKIRNISEMFADIEGTEPLIPVLERALSKNPDDRFPSCREFAAALDTLQRGIDPDFDATGLGAIVRELFAAQYVESQDILARAEEFLAKEQFEEPQTISVAVSVCEPTSRPPSPLPATPKNKLALWGGLAGLILIAGLAASWAYRQVTSPEPTPPEGQVGLPMRPVELLPVEGSPVEPPRVKVVAAPRGRKERSRRSSTPRKGKRPAPTAHAPKAEGSLDVGCLPWCEVYVNGKPIGKQSPLRGYPLAPGVYTIEVVNPPSGLRASEKVTIRASKAKRVVFHLK